MVHLVLICYDIADAKRLREVFHLCKGYGQHLQYSVFCARLDAMARVRVQADLDAVIHRKEDRVFIVDLGPDTPATRRRMTSLGRQLQVEAPGPVIV